MSRRRLRVSVVGAAGYGGGELLRLLLGHPGADVRQATSRRFAGEPVSLVHPNLRSFPPLSFCRPDEVAPCDVLFISLPNGESMGGMDRWLETAPVVIDLGADFRLRGPEDWRTWYASDHRRPGLLGRFVYGLPEIAREEVRTADRIAGPGCEAAASILGLYPLVKAGIVRSGPVIVDAKIGSSAAGAAPAGSTHHPERAGVVRTYMPTGHRHTIEIARALECAGGRPALHVTATAVDMVRGVLATIHAFPENGPLEEKDIWRVYRSAYADEPFVRLVKQSRGLYRLPEPKLLQGTNYCDIGFALEDGGGRLVVLAALDNLVKGAAGNAVQCFNLRAGFPETTGLAFAGLHPVGS
ncbi:MAG TPA: N-acetyl-gamma-glutamyl-phosphate reductase [Candidatus Aminicenantes bacterium]|nr:N-acetyl-gamma-glutamyl-phosphate reductase [Candidatus Aminicenantes bacterium]